MRNLQAFWLSLMALASGEIFGAGEVILTFNPDFREVPWALAATDDGGFLQSGHLGEGVKKFTADGYPDPAFQQILRGSPTFIVPDGRGNHFVGQNVSVGTTSYQLVKIAADGTLCGEFTPITSVGVTPGFPLWANWLTALCSDGAGGCYVGGAFVSLNGVAVAKLAHIDATGNITAVTLPVGAPTVAPDFLGRLDGGLFYANSYDAVILGDDGSLTELELPPAGRWQSIKSSGAAADPRFGVALIVYFEPNGLTSTGGIYVWDNKGRLKPSFAPTDYVVDRRLVWDDKGRLLGVSGGGQFDDGMRYGVLRLLPDGQKDPAWGPTLSFNMPTGIALPLRSGDVLVGGGFTKVAGHPWKNLVKVAGESGSQPARPQLSTRGWIKGVDESMILGLVIPSADRTVDVLIRAMSSSLSSYGVMKTTFLTRFTIYQGSEPWVTHTKRGAVANRMASVVGAFPSQHPFEAQAVVSMRPGIYTIMVTGSPSDLDWAEVLGEIYFLP